MHVTNWATAQKEDPELNAVLHWLETKKKADLKTLLRECIMSEDGQMEVEEPPELHIPPRYPLFILHPQGRRQGFVTICSTQSTLDCHPECIPSGHRTPRL